MTTTTATTPKHWDDALDWSSYLDGVEQKRDLWLSNARRATIGEAEAARLAALPGSRRVLVLSEDWCGDAIRSVPTIAAALEAAPGVEVRFLPLDSHPNAAGYTLIAEEALKVLAEADLVKEIE